MNHLFGRAKSLLTKYHMSADCLVGQGPFGRAKTLLTKYHMSADCLVGQGPF